MDEGGLEFIVWCFSIPVLRGIRGREGERALLYKANLMIVIYKTRIKVECKIKCQYMYKTAQLKFVIIHILYIVSHISKPHMYSTLIVYIIHEILCTF